MEMKRDTARWGSMIRCKGMLGLLAVVALIIVLGERQTEAATTTMSWTLGSADDWAIMGVPVKPNPGSLIGGMAVSSARGYCQFYWDHQVKSAENGLLIVGISCSQTSAVNSVIYYRQNLSRFGSYNSPNNKVSVEIWYTTKPTQGMHEIGVTAKDGTYLVCGALSFTGVNQTTPLGTPASASGSSKQPSVSVGHEANELVVDTVAAGPGAGTLTHGANQTEWWNKGSGWYLLGGGSTGAESTAVKMVYFAVTGADDGTLVRWQTEVEVATAGFNVLRGESSDGPWVKLNEDLIPSRGNSWQGASYAFEDEGKEPGTVYWYCIEEVYTGGGTTRYPARLVWDNGLSDADGDGMPDVWEGPLGIDTGTEADAKADADGDGVTNLEEYLAGTSPVDVQDYCRLRIEWPEGSDGPVLTWPGQAGRVYTVVPPVHYQYAVYVVGVTAESDSRLLGTVRGVGKLLFEGRLAP